MLSDAGNDCWKWRYNQTGYDDVFLVKTHLLIFIYCLWHHICFGLRCSPFCIRMIVYIQVFFWNRRSQYDDFKVSVSVIFSYNYENDGSANCDWKLCTDAMIYLYSLSTTMTRVNSMNWSIGIVLCSNSMY